MRVRRTLPIIAGMVATLALAPGTAGAQREPLVIDTSIAYRCADVTDLVTVHVTGSLPASGTVGEPVEPSHVTLDVSVPAAALAGLPSAATVTSVTRLEVAPVTWSAVLSDPTPLTDPVTLGGKVTAPGLTPKQAGDMAFTAGNLSVTVTGYTADGTPTEPPTVELTCVLDPAASGALATVPVAKPDGTTVVTPPPTTAPREQRDPGQLIAPLGQPLPECYKLRDKFPDLPAEYTDSFCAYLTGYSNVKKLKTSILQPAGIVNIAATKFIRTCPEGTGVLCQKAVVYPELGGEPKLPPAPGSFYAFGVIPATGTMQLTQIGLADVYLWSTTRPPYQGLTTVKVKLSAQILPESPAGVVPHIYGPTVDGAPLDVGPNCRTAEPIDAVFTGTYDSYSITKGGLLKGTVTIPPFSGCGVTEDLDPVFTGLISGPDNFVKLTQGPVCTIGGNNNGCPPVPPDPQR